MNIKRKLKVDSRSRRKPAEEDEDLKNEKEVKKEIDKDEKESHLKLQKLEAAKNLKYLQNLRLKKKGISAEDDSKNYELSIQETNETEKKSLDKQFTKNVTEKEMEDVHIELFIKENMKGIFEEKEEEKEEQEEEGGRGKREGHKGKQEKKKEKVNKSEDDIIDELYKLSDDIKVISNTNETLEKLNCITGITEIPLSAEMKLKNIEETEKMKRKILKKAKIMRKKFS